MTSSEDHRPSHLLLDRYATGELSDDEAAALEALLDDRARKHLDAIANVEVRPLDVAAIRARAAALPDADEHDVYGLFGPRQPEAQVVQEPPSMPVPANRWRWIGPLVGVLAAAVVLFAALPRAETVGHQFKNGEALVLLLAKDGALHPYVPTQAVGEGDVMGVQVGAGRYESVVVMSVDGTGAVSLFFPEAGPDPLPLDGEGLITLEGTVVLDDAPGPELFVAVYDTPVHEALDRVREAFANRGHEGLMAWATHEPGVVAAPIRRP